MKVLFLDDNPIRTKNFKRKMPFAKTSETVGECIAHLVKDDEWDIVFLDHDLGGEVYSDSEREDTGMEVVRWIVYNQPTIKTVIVHTMNPAAGPEMVAKLTDAGYDAAWHVFGSFDPYSFVE